MKWGPKHVAVHKAWQEMHDQDFEPTKVYGILAKLLKLKDEAIERGLGRLFREGKIKPKQKAPKIRKPARRASAPRGGDDFV